MLDFFRLVGRYTTLFFKESTLQIILFLDMVGIGTTYFSSYKIPTVLLYSLPIVGFYLAGFNIFRRSSPDINVKLSRQEDIEFRFVGGHAELTQQFEILIKCYFCNFGLQTGSIESLKVRTLGVNGIIDEYILDSLLIKIKEARIQKDQYRLMDLFGDKEVEFPLILKPDTMEPFYISVYVEVHSYKQAEIDEAISWLREIDFELEYKVTESQGTVNKKMRLPVVTNRLEEFKETVKARNAKLYSEEEEHLRW